MTTYNFARQLDKGQKAEVFLDKFFSEHFDYTVLTVTREQQQRGIDRTFIKRGATQFRFTVEYKTDWTASRTGNVFVETVSVDSANKPGWAFASQADLLIYYVPGDDLIYVMFLSKLRRMLPRWQGQYPSAPPIPNKGYNTLGLLVPMHEFEQHSKQVINIADHNTP